MKKPAPDKTVTRMSGRKRILCICSCALLALAGLAALLIASGAVLPNERESKAYQVRGVDVSSYQGDIDWPTLAAQDIDFAFIKATEGSSFVDPCFARNYEAARQTALRVGAYHFFSYDSPGATQADNFIAAVEKYDGMLPPVIDLEFYGDKEKNPPPREQVAEQLGAFISAVEEHYGLRPIIYATVKSYALYLSGEYEGYDIWIRSVLREPRLEDGRQWVFWQYSNRGRLEGYSGPERFIDMNVFYGTREQFAAYAARVK